MPQLSLGEKRYFVSFINDATRKVWVYPLRAKSDVLDTFKKFLAFVENQTGKKLRSLCSDNGGEYVSKAFIAFCAAKGIKRELIAPFNPSQNGVAERLNRTIKRKFGVCCHMLHYLMVFGQKLCKQLFTRSPSKALGGKVPEEVWSGKPPSYAHLRVFGCKAYVHIRSELCTKLEPKSSKCIFLGYGEDGEMGYRLWDPALRKIIRSNDVIFNENCMHKQPTKLEEVRRVVFQEDVTYGQPRRPNVQKPLHAENGAKNQPIGAENQPQEVAIDAPQVGEQALQLYTFEFDSSCGLIEHCQRKVELQQYNNRMDVKAYCVVPGCSDLLLVGSMRLDLRVVNADMVGYVCHLVVIG
ncbi:hypothetical protein L7F22_065281 [Adiantum nelumboides]|nr:hypothetical protein [Adiantum nelumboides]